MPTFNQLVRTGRKTIEKKSKTPALLKGLNTKKNVVTEETEIDENAEFKILEECTGSHHGQIDMIMTAYKGEIPVGYMQYSIFEDAPHINNIEVMPSQRRRGIATRLLQNLQGQYPTFEIVWGIMTDDGKALHDAA
mgnify:CR=1 FL=1